MLHTTTQSHSWGPCMLSFPHSAFKISYFASLSKTGLIVAYIPDDTRARQVKYHLKSILITNCRLPPDKGNWFISSYCNCQVFKLSALPKYPDVGTVVA